MDRRQFFKTGVAAAAAGAAVSLPTGAAPAVESRSAKPDAAKAPAILVSFTAEDHRRRLKNIAACTQKIRKCMRKHLIADYLPAQCVYNMGEYPSQKRWEPEEYDEQELDRLKAHGIQLIHVMDEWNDRYGMFGGNKLTAVNPQGFKRFVEMVHRRGMKILAYASTGYFIRTDPDYREDWKEQLVKNAGDIVSAVAAFVITRYVGGLPRHVTIAVPILAGVVAGIVGSLVTRPPNRETLERFLTKIYVPIGQEAKLALPLDEAVPPSQRWLTAGGLFVVKPTRQTWLGFLVTLAICVLCVVVMQALLRG